MARAGVDVGRAVASRTRAPQQRDAALDGSFCCRVPMKPARQNGACALKWAGAATLAYAACEPWRIAVREFEVTLPNLPPDAQGLRIAQLSDIHAGLLMPWPLVRRVVRLCAACAPDVVVITGDAVTRRNAYPPPLRALARPVTDYAEGLARELKTLKPRFGVYIAPGNHDLWEGDFGPVAEILARAKVVALLNRSVRLPGGLPLVGTDDLRAGHPNLRAAFEGVAPAEAQIILSHNPRLALLLRARNALILSGHTHGGQVALPARYRPAPVDAGQSFFRQGWFGIGRAQLYVSSGSGTLGVPVRLGVRPEIAVFTLSNGFARPTQRGVGH